MHIAQTARLHTMVTLPVALPVHRGPSVYAASSLGKNSHCSNQSAARVYTTRIRRTARSLEHA